MSSKRQGGGPDARHRKFQRQEHGGKGAGLPIGKQGILITVEHADSSKASREALTVMTEVYEEFLKTLPADATAAASVISSKPAAVDAAQASDAPAPTQAADPSAAHPSADASPEATGSGASGAAQGDSGTAHIDSAPEPAAAVIAEAAPAAAAQDTAKAADVADAVANTSDATCAAAEAAKPALAGAGASTSADYSSLIAQEVSGLKDKKQKHFVFHDTGIRTLFFLEMPTARPGAGPCEVVKFLLETGQREKNLQFRFCTRFLPCTHICKADKAAIAQAAKQLVHDNFDCSADAKPERVAVQYEHRAAPKELKRADVIDVVVEPVPRPPHKVDLTNATKTLSCQVVRTACGLAVLDDYAGLGKYNIKTVTQVPAELEDKE